MAKKFYVVWVGRLPGVYASWRECKEQVEGFAGAKYKSFSTELEAQRAYSGSPLPSSLGTRAKGGRSGADYPIFPSIAVDGASSGNPGMCEYRGVNADSHEVIFASQQFFGTNNIAEFLAIVHAMVLCRQQGVRTPIYSDSRTAMAWVRTGKCKTTLKPSEKSAFALDLIRRAEAWLAQNPPEVRVPLLKWKTEVWGEIPADYGRK